MRPRTTPQQRLLNGHFDRNRDFVLRVATLENLDRLQQSPARGLLGSRTSLLPHQLYIAAEVGQRHAPRVLLADEVGLGKTIEAGMIMQQQLLTGRASRWRTKQRYMTLSYRLPVTPLDEPRWARPENGSRTGLPWTAW